MEKFVTVDEQTIKSQMGSKDTQKSQDRSNFKKHRLRTGRKTGQEEEIMGPNESATDALAF